MSSLYITFRPNHFCALSLIFILNLSFTPSPRPPAMSVAPARAPAVHTSNDATFVAGLSAARMVNNDQPARLPPTVCAPYREKDSGDMPAQHFEGNSRGLVEIIAHAFGEDFDAKFRASSPCTANEHSVTGSVELQVVSKDSTGICGHVTPSGCAPSISIKCSFPSQTLRAVKTG